MTPEYLVRKGVGSNPTLIKLFLLLPHTSIGLRPIGTDRFKGGNIYTKLTLQF